MRQVLVVQPLVKWYTRPLYDGLHAALARAGVGFSVAYGDPPPGEASKKDNIRPDPRYSCHVGSRWLLGDRLVYQPVLGLARRADLVIVNHENRHLVNIPLMLRSRLGRGKLALWGHGRGVQASPWSPAERIKAYAMRFADWYFAYTQGVADYLVGKAFPTERITVINNTIDAAELRAQVDAVDETELGPLRRRFRIAEGARIALFCGSLHPGKRLPFLFKAVHEVRRRVPAFHLIVVGAGPEQELVEAEAARSPWIHAVGPASGRDKAALLRLAEIVLLPAGIGLAIIDAFAAGRPLISTDLPRGHGVEKEYLTAGVNGLVSRFDAVEYAQAIARALQDESLLASLSVGARASGGRYTIEAMVQSFRDGVLQCLAL
jgi:glycosyltransferase involved in cell wall biosynthesis